MSNSITRRSFIKRSVVATVAASNLTLFSGLVNASYWTGSSPFRWTCQLDTAWLETPYAGPNDFKPAEKCAWKAVDGGSHAVFVHLCLLECRDIYSGHTFESWVQCGGATPSSSPYRSPYDAGQAPNCDAGGGSFYDNL